MLRPIGFARPREPPAGVHGAIFIVRSNGHLIVSAISKRAYLFLCQTRRNSPVHVRGINIGGAFRLQSLLGSLVICRRLRRCVLPRRCRCPCLWNLSLSLSLRRQFQLSKGIFNVLIQDIIRRFQRLLMLRNHTVLLSAHLGHRLRHVVSPRFFFLSLSHRSMHRKQQFELRFAILFQRFLHEQRLELRESVWRVRVWFGGLWLEVSDDRERWPFGIAGAAELD